MNKIFGFLKSLFKVKSSSPPKSENPGEAPRTEPAGPSVPDSILDLPWMKVANKEIGVKEIYGRKHSERVLEYHGATSLGADDDETAWCASFMSWVLQEAGFKTPRTARARDFLKYGTKLDKPQYGCIVVYDRGDGKGHVHFYEYEENGEIYGLGGNQSNAVNTSGYDKDKVLGFRWPVRK